MIQILTNESDDRGMRLKVMIGIGADTRNDLNATMPGAREARGRTNI